MPDFDSKSAATSASATIYPAANITASAILIENLDLSGDVSLGTSMTDQASQNPDQFQTDALEKRLNMYAKALSNADDGNNDRSETGSL